MSDLNTLRTSDNEREQIKNNVSEYYKRLGQKLRHVFLSSQEGQEVLKWLLKDKLGLYSAEIFDNPEINLANKNLAAEILGIMGVYHEDYIDTLIRKYADVANKGAK